MTSKKSLEELLKYEKNLWKKGVDFIAGVDEVGRGSLAGPMVVCAVILNPKHLKEYNNLPSVPTEYTQIQDSKMLPSGLRCLLANFLHIESLCYSIIEVPHNIIDEDGLTRCTKSAFFNAVNNLEIKPGHILTDSFEIDQIEERSQTNLIRGDSKSLTIAAASIIAKEHRDSLMTFYHKAYDKYKVYGFDKHKGYGTKLHKEMIKKYGFSDIHRKSYKINLSPPTK